ncbi:MAG: hypothetical protein ACR2PO_10480 [Methyloligellaceae bacterium]
MTHDSNPRCEMCSFWTGRRLDKSGECRRFPPAVYWSSSMGKALFRWPEAPAAGWCAEWRGGEAHSAAGEPTTEPYEDVG